MNQSAIDQDIRNSSEDRSIFVDLLLLMSRNMKIVFGVPAAAALVGLVVALILPKWYSATAKIMPPQQSQSNAVAILGQLGVLAGGAGQALGIKNPSDIYVTMLRSRTISDALIRRFDLQRVYSEKYLIDTRKELEKHASISAGREGVITIEVEDTDPKRAADIANAYVEELRARTLTLAVSEASQRRLFFEGQLHKAKNDLTNAEAELMQFTKGAALVSPQGQISLSVAAAASLRAQITAKEIQLTAMRSFATDSNPDLQRTVQELSGLRTELAKMEKDSKTLKGDVMVPFDKAPGFGLEYLRRYRDMKYYETLFEVLAKQYEIARIDEAKDATLIQPLDVALPSELRSRPKIWLFMLLSTILAFIATLSFLVSRQKLVADPMLLAEFETHWQFIRHRVLKQRS